MKQLINNSDINKLCEKCTRKCKQKKEITLLSCPKFKQKPVQLTMNFGMMKLNEEVKNKA